MGNLNKATALAEKCFKTKFRKTGEPYVQHCYNVVQILKDSGLEDEKLLVAAMLHDVCEDTDIYNPEIQKHFGDRVGFIINVLSKNKKPDVINLKETFKPDATHKTFEEYVDYRFLMYVNRFYMGALADPYVLFIKIADQIDNMATVEIFSDEKIERKIWEIKKYFMPIYEKALGLYKKIHENDTITSEYYKKFVVLKNRLKNVVAEKEKMLTERLPVNP